MFFDALASACRVAGYASCLDGIRAVVERAGGVPCCGTARASREGDFQQLQQVAARSRPTPVVALLGFPRYDHVQRAISRRGGSRVVDAVSAPRSVEHAPRGDVMTKKQTPTADPTAASCGDQPKGRYAFHQPGCPKNLVDSERMLGLFQLEGYELVADPEGTDFVVVNTCGFIEQAREESYAAIDEMLRLKRAGKTRGVIVSGAWPNARRNRCWPSGPISTRWSGVFGREQITEVADRLVGHLAEQRTVFRSGAGPSPAGSRPAAHHAAALRLPEDLRRLRSLVHVLRDPEDARQACQQAARRVVAEAQQLAADGVRELIVVAQDTTYYGMDLYGEPRLTSLLQRAGSGRRRLDSLDVLLSDVHRPAADRDDCRLRQDPAVYRPAAATHQRPPAAPHGTPRDARRDRIAADAAAQRDSRPGPPYDTHHRLSRRDGGAHEELCEFVQQQRFERLGVFTYSLEDNTPVRGARRPCADRDATSSAATDLMQIQQQIVIEHNRGPGRPDPARDRGPARARTSGALDRRGPQPTRRTSTASCLSPRAGTIATVGRSHHALRDRRVATIRLDRRGEGEAVVSVAGEREFDRF